MCSKRHARQCEVHAHQSNVTAAASWLSKRAVVGDVMQVLEKFFGNAATIDGAAAAAAGAAGGR